jgi:hypothetical protein
MYIVVRTNPQHSELSPAQPGLKSWRFPFFFKNSKCFEYNKYRKKWRGFHITIRVKPEVGWNGTSLCGIESLYSGLSKTTKAFDIHFPKLAGILERI